MPPAAGNSNSWDEVAKQYPAPLAPHDVVAGDPVIFWDTLRRFHFMMGTRTMIPVIGGKELDLYILYVEVTKRGGYERVVADKKWREVGNVFMFSPTTTSASFVLKKHYLSLLFHYEQVHFFRHQVFLSTPSETCSSPPESMSESKIPTTEYSPNAASSNGSDSTVVKGTSCFSALGTIDGKFDYGYLVSVRVGSEILKGVLYHYRPEAAASSGGGVPQADHSTALVPYCGGRRRTRRSKRRRDPSYPKPNRSGYNFFFQEKHNKLKALYPNREREFTKMIGHSWNNLTSDERLVYQKIGLKDKERYKRELKEYKERLSLNQGSASIAPTPTAT